MSAATERARLNLLDALAGDGRTDIAIAAAAWGDLAPGTRKTRLARMKLGAGLTLTNLAAVAAALGFDWSHLCRRPLVYGVVVDGDVEAADDGVCFEFNGVTVWHEASDLPVSEAKRVGYWTPERAAEQALREQEAEAEAERKSALIKQALEAYPFELCPAEAERPSDYAAYKEKNSQDGYSRGIVDYGEAWAALMSEAIANGSTVAKAAKETSGMADVGGITGFMYGCAVSALAKFWIHGEALRHWHNVDAQIGDEGDKANESGGVLNPALLSIG